MPRKDLSNDEDTSRKWRRPVMAVMFALGLAALTGTALAASNAHPETTHPEGKFVAAPRPPLHPYVLLYNQYNYIGTNSAPSQNFEPALDGYDDETADDFVNPGPDTWLVTIVEVDGWYYQGNPPPGGPAASVNVTFYNDAAGIPGWALASRPAQAYIDTNGGQGDFSITLSTPVSVPPGAYWLSVQVNMDYNPTGRWAWIDRTVQTGNPAKWRSSDPGTCFNWTNRYSCTLTGSNERDQVFRLLGPPAPTPTPCPDCTILYDQNGSLGSNATQSQNYEATYDAFDDELADDFVNPGPDTWSVTTVEVEGQYSDGAPPPGGPAASVNVTFYNDAGGSPGSALASRPAQTYIDPSGGLGDFIIVLSTPVSVPPGAYWLSVQANMDFVPSGLWGWTDRTVQTGNPAMWQNPGNGFGSGCTTWGAKTACGRPSSGPDQVFRLTGNAGPTPTPCVACTNTPVPPTNTLTPINTITPTNTPHPDANLVGHVIWQQIPQNDPRSVRPITLTLKLGGTEVNYPQQNTDSSGYFTVPVGSLPGGVYYWRVLGTGSIGGNIAAGFLANCGTVGLTGAPLTTMENSQVFPALSGCTIAPGCIRGGDANHNNVINASDFGILKNEFSQTGVRRPDFNNDLIVGVTDYNILKGNFSLQGCSGLAFR